MGVPWNDAPTIGNLLGTRMALNEFVAYSQLGPLKAIARSEVVHDRDLRAVRLRELQLDRHPDRRHRRAGAEPPPRSGAARPARDVRRHAGEFHDGHDRRVPLYPMAYLRSGQRSGRRRSRGADSHACREIAIVLGSGLGDFADTLSRRGRRCPTTTLPHWPAARVIGHEGRLVVGTVRGRTIAALAGRCHVYEGHDLQRR